ncbi:hypothetical protein PtB15_7B342 [Puccinia triticina]|nr:hypothetical protein PtB15_7B342 [Puccinia triticina]
MSGWTKIWNVLRAVPLTKYGLTSARQPNGESNVTYFRPRTINLLSAFFYGFPVIFGGLPVCLITKEISEINKTFLEYSHSYSTIHNGRTTTTQSMTEFNAETTKQTSSMIYSGEKLVFLWRLLSTGYCCNIVILFLIMAFGYFRIFQAVRYQTQTFRKSFEQHTSLAIRSHPVERSSTLKSTSISEGCNKPSVNFTQLTERAWIPQTIASWSPTSHQEPDSLRNINYPPSNSHSPTLGTQEWQSVNREKALSQYKALIKYERNLVWQASCNALIMLSFLGMNVAVWCNWMQVPTRHSLSDLTWFIITWSSVSWVFAVGLPAGLVACLSSRSPPITFLRENVQCAGPEHR